MAKNIFICLTGAEREFLYDVVDGYNRKLRNRHRPMDRKHRGEVSMPLSSWHWWMDKR